MIREWNPPKLILITAAIWVNITAIKQSTTKFSAVHQIRRKTGHNCGAKLMSSNQKNVSTNKIHRGEQQQQQQQEQQQDQELIFEAKMRGEHTYVQSTIQGVSPVWAPPVTWPPSFLVSFPIRPFREWVCVSDGPLWGKTSTENMQYITVGICQSCRVKLDAQVTHAQNHP